MSNAKSNELPQHVATEELKLPHVSRVTTLRDAYDLLLRARDGGVIGLDEIIEDTHAAARRAARDAGLGLLILCWVDEQLRALYYSVAVANADRMESVSMRNLFELEPSDREALLPTTAREDFEERLNDVRSWARFNRLDVWELLEQLGYDTQEPVTLRRRKRTSLREFWK